MSFFFFKQKTAYEMRISDWSSDVCSSDLATGWSSWSPSCRLARLDRLIVGNQRFVEARQHVQHDIAVRLLVHRVAELGRTRQALCVPADMLTGHVDAGVIVIMFQH